MVIKKHKLEVAIDEDFCLLGMVTDEPDYKICWFINHLLQMNFEKQDDITLFHNKLNKDQVFSMFSYHDKESFLTYRIINNRPDRGFFIDELKNLDYLVHVQGEIAADKINSFLQQVSNIGTVRMCVPVDLTRIRNKERLLLW